MGKPPTHAPGRVKKFRKNVGKRARKKKKKNKQASKKERRADLTQEVIPSGKLRKKIIIPSLHTYLHRYISVGLYEKVRRLA